MSSSYHCEAKPSCKNATNINKRGAPKHVIFRGLLDVIGAFNIITCTESTSKNFISKLQSEI